MTDLPRISVLVVQEGQADLSHRAFDSVRRSTYGGEVELLLWDNGSPNGPGTVDDDVTLVESHRSLGFGGANNELASHATGDLLLLLNNDVILTPTCLGRLVECLTSDPSVAVVTPQFRGFSGELQEAGAYLGPAGRAYQMVRGCTVPPFLAHTPYPAHYGSGACLLIRRRDFERSGGFDARFSPAYYEDTDLCMRLRAEGRSVLVEPRAVAFHFEGGTAGRDLDRGVKRFQLRNRGRFAARWSRELEALPPPGPGSALRQAIAAEGQPLVLWLLPEFLRPDHSGGHARILKMLDALTAAGLKIFVWSEHAGEGARYGPELSARGIAWSGYHEPVRSDLDRGPWSPTSSLVDLLRLGIWDAVVCWSVDFAHRFSPLVREHLPNTPLVIDSTVLLYRQFERGRRIGAAMTSSMEAEKSWEMDTYRLADGVSAASEDDAEAIREELPDMDVFTFDVGGYEPVESSSRPPAGDLLYLGSFVHPPNLDAIAWWIDEIAPLVAARLRRVPKLRVVGAWSELVTQVLGQSDDLEVVGWVEDLGEEMRNARAFVAPLRYGAGTKDKIAMAMRYGLPTVTTTIGAESMPPALEKALIVRDEAEGFAAAVADLLRDDEIWARSAASTRRAAASAWQAQDAIGCRYADWLSRYLRSSRRRP